MTITIHKRYHGKLDLITLENGPLKATFLNFGARLYQLLHPIETENQRIFCFLWMIRMPFYRIKPSLGLSSALLLDESKMDSGRLFN